MVHLACGKAISMTDPKGEKKGAEKVLNDFQAGYAWGRHDATCGKINCEEHVYTTDDVDAELDMVRKAQEYKVKAALADRFSKADCCPYCPNVGWYAQANMNTGEPEQIQCEWCETKETSLFKVMADYDRLAKGERP